MNTIPVCPKCGKPLNAGSTQGLCPACLMQGAMPSGTVPGEKAPGFVPPSVSELAPKFPQLEILDFIGQGGMGAVYKARQKELGRIVALKILPPDIGQEGAFAERFTREARALARLNHPGIVTIHDFGRAGGLYYFLMEFVDGVNLRQLLQAGRVSAREALAIVPQICDALQFAHDQGIVHRDIKPENILLDRRGRVKVADFGLAKIMEDHRENPTGPGASEPTRGANQTGEPAGDPTAAGKIMGTPQYMSPEQITAPGEVDHRADIYALGVVFYQMLTGELPGKTIAPPSSKVQIDVRLDEVVLRALETKPELRYPQASALKTQIETVTAQIRAADAATAPASNQDANRVKTHSKKYVVLAVVVLLLMVGAVSAWLFLRESSMSQRPRLSGEIASWSGDSHGQDPVGGFTAKVSPGITYAPANVGSGFSFDGGDNRIEVPDHPELDFGPGQDFSIAGWIQPLSSPPDSYNEIMSIVDKRETPNIVVCQGYELALWAGKIVFHMSDSLRGNGVTWGLSSGYDLRDGKFHHVAVTVERRSPTGGKMFVDGKMVLTFDPTEVPGDLGNSQPLRIGNHSDPSLKCFFHGTIGQISVFKRALGVDEVAQLFHSGGGVIPAEVGPPASPVAKVPDEVRHAKQLRARSSHPAGLVALWSGDGNGMDSAGDNDAELTDVTLADGLAGRAFSFDGVKSAIRVPASPALDLGAGDGFTIMAWIKPAGVDGLHPILQWSDNGEVNLEIGVRPYENGVLLCSIGQKDRNYTLCTHPDVLVKDAFQHIAYTYDKAAGTGTLYLNGVMVAQRQLKPQLVARTKGDLWFSHHCDLPGNWSTGRTFSGLMDNVELYNRALSAAEIQSVCQSESGGQTLSAPSPSTGWFESWMR
jgi:serine/threonine protein kinase